MRLLAWQACKTRTSSSWRVRSSRLVNEASQRDPTYEAALRRRWAGGGGQVREGEVAVRGKRGGSRGAALVGGGRCSASSPRTMDPFAARTRSPSYDAPWLFLG